MTAPHAPARPRTPLRLAGHLALLVAVVLGLAAAAPATSAAPGRQARMQQGTAFGAYVEGMQQDPGALARFEKLIGRRTAIASYYYGFGDVFPAATELAFADGGRRDVLLSWDMGPTRFTEWSSGAHDAYLDQIVAAARAYPHDVYVRPWPEMNGDWQEFQPTAAGEKRYGGTPREFVAAWRHVVDHVRAGGATNVKWVFNPTADVYAETTPVATIWPGAAYVDVLGLDGFNWGEDRRWGRWLTFKQIFTAQYRNLTALHPTAPVWVCEFGSKEPRENDGAPAQRRRSKGAWLRDALTSRAFPRLDALIYFHADKERDWRLNSSGDALRAARSVLTVRARSRWSLSR